MQDMSSFACSETVYVCMYVYKIIVMFSGAALIEVVLYVMIAFASYRRQVLRGMMLW